MYNLTEILSILQSKGLVKDKMTINLYEDGLPIPCGRYPNLDFSLFFLKRN